MSLPHIILAHLKRKPATGYDITSSFKDIDGVYWKAQHQQVYRELTRMTTQKEVKYSIFPQEGKPDRKVYTITPKGVESLAKWVGEPTKIAIFRDELCAKIVASTSETLSVVLDDINDFIDQSLFHIEQIEGIMIGLEDDSKKKKTHINKMEQIMLSRSLSHYQSQYDWGVKTLDDLRT